MRYCKRPLLQLMLTTPRSTAYRTRTTHHISHLTKPLLSISNQDLLSCPFHVRLRSHADLPSVPRGTVSCHTKPALEASSLSADSFAWNGRLRTMRRHFFSLAPWQAGMMRESRLSGHPGSCLRQWVSSPTSRTAIGDSRSFRR
jgi:hypothetical protein